LKNSSRRIKRKSMKRNSNINLVEVLPNRSKLRMRQLAAALLFFLAKKRKPIRYSNCYITTKTLQKE